MLARILAGCVGAVIAFAGASKVTNMKKWQLDAEAQHIWKFVAVILPGIELVLGAVLVVLKPNPITLGAATSLLIVFTVLLTIRISEKSTVPCACFGSRSSRPPAKKDVFRNLLMIAVLFASVAII